MGIPYEERLKREDLRRASAKCPVIRRMNRVLSARKFLDIGPALVALRSDLIHMPEADASVKLIDRLQAIVEGVKND